MDKINTLGDFRKLISTNGGSLALGKMRFDCEGEDIDAYLADNLVQWVNKSEPDEKPIAEVEFTLSTGVEKYNEAEEQESKARRENRTLKEEIIEMTLKMQDQSTLTGELKVYKKILGSKRIIIENDV